MPKRILLADDSLTIQKVVELTLAGTDYELTCVSNGQKALESIERSRPDLILADVVMPEKNGYEVCEAVKSNPSTAQIPLLLLSGTFEPFDRERADRIGADRVVSKPFDAEELLEQIETLLTRGAGVAAEESGRSREASSESEFLDDTIPTARAVDRSETVELGSPFEGPSVSAVEERQASRAKPSSGAGEEPGGEDFSGGPVFLSPGEIQAVAREARAGHRAGRSPSPESREPEAGAEPAEEISAEEAGVLFDMPAGAALASVPASASELTEAQIERIAALVVAKLSDRVLREIVWEVVPDVAEMVVKRRIEELESGVE